MENKEGNNQQEQGGEKPQQQQQQSGKKGKSIEPDPVFIKLQSQHEGSKDHKKFMGTYSAVMGIYAGGGEKLLSKQRADQDVIDKAIEEILKTSAEDFQKEVEQDIKDLAKAIMEFEKEKEAKMKQYFQALAAAEKALKEKGDKILAKVKDRNTLSEKYRRSFSAYVSADATDASDESEESDEEK